MIANSFTGRGPGSLLRLDVRLCHWHGFGKLIGHRAESLFPFNSKNSHRPGRVDMKDYTNGPLTRVGPAGNLCPKCESLSFSRPDNHWKSGCCHQARTRPIRIQPNDRYPLIGDVLNLEFKVLFAPRLQESEFVNRRI